VRESHWPRSRAYSPKVLDEIPLTITTTVKSPYADRVSPDGLMLYSSRGTDPEHPENVGLRKAMLQGTPLIYLHALMPSKYMAVWPVFIVGDDPSSLTFSVELTMRTSVLTSVPRPMD